MYIPKYHAFTDEPALHTHIADHPLGTWVCLADGNLVANHIPLLLDRAHGPHGRLIGHVSRANPVWRQLSGGAASVVTFMGPQAYITPAWYPGKSEHGKVVPTWNYVTVHVHGTARAVEEPSWMLDMLTRLTDAQEAPNPAPWKVTDAPSDYVQRMLRAIVGIEITIERLEGRLKVSQDEDTADRHGTVQGLQQMPDTQTQAMAALVHKALGA